MNERRESQMKITTEQKQQIINLFPHLPTKTVAAETQVAWATIRSIASRERLTKSNYLWKSKDIIFLLKNNKLLPINEIAKKIGRTKWACYAKLRELTINK